MQKDTPSSLWRTSAAAESLDWLHEHDWLVETGKLGDKWTATARKATACHAATGNNLAAALLDVVVQIRGTLD